MAKDRIQPCVSYVCEGAVCKKGRKAEHSGYCQKCSKYEPRARVKEVNRKKSKLEKIRNKEIDY